MKIKRLLEEALQKIRELADTVKIQSCEYRVTNETYIMNGKKVDNDVVKKRMDAVFKKTNEAFNVMEDAFNMIRDIDVGEPHKYRNFYRCGNCGHEWDSTWSCTCDERCPKCQISIRPYRSEDL